MGKAELRGNKSCCGSINAYFLHQRKLKKKKKQEEIDRLTNLEKKELGIVKKKNFVLQYMYSSYKATNNPPNKDPAPYGGWVFLIVDTLAVCVCVFSMYFIIGFGVRYGPVVAELWLTQFVTSILTTFVICDPLLIFIKSAIIPSIVHRHVLSHPELIATGGAGSGAPAFMGASFNILGAPGQTAALIGMGAAAVGGAISAAANKWKTNRLKKIERNNYLRNSDDEYEPESSFIDTPSPSIGNKSGKIKKRGSDSKYVLSESEIRALVLDKRTRRKLQPIMDHTILEVVMNLLAANIFGNDSNMNLPENKYRTSTMAKEELSKTLVQSLGGDKSYMALILELFNENVADTLRDAISVAAAKQSNIYNNHDNTFASLRPIRNHQYIAQLAESSIEYWIACGISRVSDALILEKRKEDKARQLSATRKTIGVGKGVLHGLGRDGKKIRKSILHFKDTKKSELSSDNIVTIMKDED